MSRFVPALTVLAALLLQVGLAPYIAIGGVVPNMLLLIVVTLALVKGPRTGMIAGFGAGLLFDLLGTTPIGAAALVFCVVGFVAGSVQQNTFADGWLVPLIIVFVSSLAAETLFALLLAVLGEGQLTIDAVTGGVLPAAVYNAALAALTYPWVARFLRREKPMTTFKRLA